jgi:ABC-type amino acid transport substrate-binding protein
MVPIGEPEWRDVLNSWVTLKRTDGTVQKLYDYWILGKDAESHEPRWSVIRNVLHWVD